MFQARVILSAAKDLLFPLIHKQMLRFAQHDMLMGCTPKTALSLSEHCYPYPGLFMNAKGHDFQSCPKNS
ncbi:MAG: hypothetical protein ACRD2G_17795, partial [Terriglobia bacterium]